MFATPTISLIGKRPIAKQNVEINAVPRSTNMRILHTMLRVGNLKESIRFYTQVLEMKLLRQKDYPSGRFTLAFLGYGPEDETSVIELTHNWDIDNYELGKGYGHIAIGVENIYDTCKKISSNGGKVVRPPGAMKHGQTIIAFIEDPDGYKIELIEKALINNSSD